LFSLLKHWIWFGRTVVFSNGILHPTSLTTVARTPFGRCQATSKRRDDHENKTMNITAMLAFAGALFSGALAFMACWRERKSIAHRSFAAGMTVLAVESVFNGFSLNAASVKEMVYWQNWELASISFLPGIWLLFSLSYGRGNYREFLKRWRSVLILAFLIPVGLVVLSRGKMIVSANQNNAGHWIFALGIAGIVLNCLFLLGAVLVLINLERTFRASVGTMRWRIKFMILGLGVLFVVRSCISSQMLLFHAIDLSWQTVNSVALLVSCLLILRSLFRAGHFDMDVYPSHSVLQGSLTALLAGIYLLIIGVFAKLVTFGGGDAAFTLKAFVMLVGLVLLTVLLLSDRVRVHTSRFISRNFQRPSYDYRTVWRKFTEGTAACVTQKELCQASVKLTADVFQVLSVTMWLVDEKKEQLVFAASTFLSEARADALNPKNTDATNMIATLQKHPEPVDIDSSKEKWAAALRLRHPDEFHKDGNRVCVPVVVGGEILGLMILGDRVGGGNFSQQDFDLLKCVGDQIAAGLLNARLSQKLLQAKELEAFQTMSAFFVHDLKNAASTLNLMLQNLPAHFDDPAFREDAVRVTAKSVAHINRLIERLGHLRHELKIKPAEADLNEIISRFFAGWEKAAGVSLAKNFQPLPKFNFDPEQLLKVVTNLILNAKEAVAQNGEIQIATRQINGHAVLSVSDNGCGMNPEFLSRSLFRPFQTTKKNGLGIGMFQSKMIVEAHKGRIEVESEPGKGTTFRIYLPLQK
jgi:putative PEP-CTERM system histidine kinase